MPEGYMTVPLKELDARDSKTPDAYQPGRPRERTSLVNLDVRCFYDEWLESQRQDSEARSTASFDESSDGSAPRMTRPSMDSEESMEGCDSALMPSGYKSMPLHELDRTSAEAYIMKQMLKRSDSIGEC